MDVLIVITLATAFVVAGWKMISPSDTPENGGYKD